MNQLTKVFMYGSAVVRTVTVEGEPWFVAKDIADVLEFSETSAMTRYLDDDEKTNLSIRQDGSNLTTNITTISESGLYSAILRSRKPEARAFKRWVTHEVIPSIRKTGMYATDSLLDDPELMLKTVTRLTEERRARLAAEALLVEQAPKVEAFDTFLSADGAQTMGDVAKALHLGRNILYARLRKACVLMDGNAPYQRYMKAGYFVVQETVKGGKGFIKPCAVTLVTPKGVAFIERLLAKGEEAA